MKILASAIITTLIASSANLAASSSLTSPIFDPEICDGPDCTPSVIASSGGDWTLTIPTFQVVGQSKASAPCEPCRPCQTAMVWDYDGESKWKIYDSTGLTSGYGPAGGLYRFSAKCGALGDSWDAYTPNFWGTYTIAATALLICDC